MKEKNMTYEELENKVIENRKKMKKATDKQLGKLIEENQRMIAEMDRRWEGR